MNNVVPLHAAPTRPVPVVVATVLLAVAAIRLVYLALALLFELEWVAVFPIGGLALWAWLLVKLWQGRRGAYVITVVGACLNIMSALAAGSGFFLPEQRDPNNPLGLMDGVLSVTRVGVALAVLLLLVASRQSRAFFARP